MSFNRKNKWLSLLAAGAFLAACGNEATNETANSSAGENDSASEKVELTIATWASETEADEFNALIDEINASQDDYVLEQMMIPQDYYTKIQTMIAGNQAPDLLWLAQEYIPAYAKNGAVLDITDRLDNQDIIDMDDYLSGSLDTATYEEGIYGLPWIGQPYVVYYNKTYFEENGIAEPSLDWTWDDFQETAKAATTEDMYGFATTGNPPTAVFIWGEGGEIVENDGTVRSTEPDSVKGIELASEISTSENTMPYQEAMSMGVEQAFVNGEIAMMVGGANDDVERKVEDAGGEFEVGMAIMPAGSKEHVTFNWTASTLISEQTEQPDVAFEALVDITNAIFEWKVPSPMASKVEKIGEINPYKAYAVDTIIKSAEISRGFNNLPEQNELGAQQWEMLDLPVLSNDNGQGNVNPQEIADQTAEAFENIIK